MKRVVCIVILTVVAILGGQQLRSQTVKFFVAKINRDDLRLVAELLEAGKVRSVNDRRVPLSEAADALRYLGEGHARGKVIITV